jgi:hypothetical protein
MTADNSVLDVKARFGFQGVPITGESDGAMNWNELICRDRQDRRQATRYRHWSRCPVPGRQRPPSIRHDH